MSYFSEVAMGLDEERAGGHTATYSGSTYGSEGYIVTYEITTDKGIEDKETFIKGDLFEASRYAGQFLGKPNIDEIYVWDKKTGVVVESVSDMARMKKG